MSTIEQNYKNLSNEEKKNEFINSFYDKFKQLFGVTKKELESYYDESIHSGYPYEPGGSVWELEGKSIYCMIRCLKPKKILEIGNYKGKSTNHILQAVEKNGFGEVTLVDIKEYLEYDKLHNRNFNRVLQDSLEYLKQPLDFDCYIIDGCHTYEHVKKELELISNNTKIDFTVWAHDYYVLPHHHCEVKKAWDELNNNFKEVHLMKDSYSDCGFLIAKFKK